MNLFSISCLLIIISHLSIAMFILWKNKGSEYAKLWALFSIVASFWGYGGFKLSIAPTANNAFFWWQMAYIGVIFSPIVFYHFVYVYFHRGNKSLIYFSYFLGTNFILLDLFQGEHFLGDVRFLFNQFYWIIWSTHKSLLFLFFYFYCHIFLLSLCLINLIKELSAAKGIQRSRVKFFVIGSILGWIGAEFNFFVSFEFNIYPYLNFLIGLYPFFFGYAIVRHQLLDIHIVVKKSIVYTILIASITLIYLIIVVTIEKLLEFYMGYRSIFISVATAFSLGILFVPFRNKIQYFIDKHFFYGTLESLSQEKQRLQQELFHKEKLAYVGQLASSVVHEIRNPLTTVDTFIKYLPAKYNDPVFRNKFNTLIPQEIDRLKNVVDRLLDLSKPANLKLSRINICNLVDSTLNLLDDRFMLKKISITRHYDNTGLMLSANADQLKQVFLNLFINALDAMEDSGSLRICIQKSKNSKNMPNGYALIEISDSGHGIPPSLQGKLFTPFITTKKDGIGLGLVISQEIIREHGGTINAKSEVGTGTTFTITLPIKKA